MDEESLSCLICSRACSSDESLVEFIPGGTERENTNSFTCPQLEAQLNVVFVLRKLLELPEQTCAELISSHGNPTDWGQAFCLQCTGFIEEAQDVSQKIMNYRDKFKCLQLKIWDELRYSYDENETGVYGKTNVDLRSQIRTLCLEGGSQHTSQNSSSLEKRGRPFKTTVNVENIQETADKPLVTNTETDEVKSSLSNFVFPTPIIVKIKTECTFEDELNLSPAEPFHDDTFTVGFDSDNDFLDPGSVVKVLSEEVESAEEDTVQYSKRSLRSVSAKLQVQKLSSSKEPNKQIKSKHKGKSGSITNPISKDNKKEVEYKCPLCPKILFSVNFLNLHYKKIHLGITSAKDNSRKVLKKNQKKCSTSKSSSSKSRGSRGERKYKFKCPDSECPQHFPSEYFRDAHYKRKHLGIEKPFQCNKCGKAYDRNACLVIHKKTCSGDGTFIFPADPKLQESVKIKCPQCPRNFATDIFRDAHVKRVHEGIDRPHNCHICDKKFQRYSGLSEHLKGLHQLITVEIPQSKNSSGSNDEADINRKDNSSPEPDDDEWVPPDDMDANMSSEDENDSMSQIAISPIRKKRKLQKEEDEDKESNEESKMSTRNRKSDLSKEIRPKKSKRKSIFPIKQRAPVTKIYRCTHEGCKKIFHLEMQLDGHVKQAHEGIPKPFKCDHDQCDKAYGRYSTLQIHKESSHGENNDTFICENCGKTFFNPSAFKRHVYYVHDRPYKKKSVNKHPCDECGKFFKGPSGVLRHKENVHCGNRVFKCTECDIEFPTKMQLSFHRRTKHLEARVPIVPVKCPQCDKSFNGANSLKRHEKLTHRQEYKFTCSVCQMGFGDRCSHERHMLTHTGEKPFKCETCGKGLTRRGDLNRHMRLHTGEKPFTCEQCGVSFTDSSKLTKHQKTHGEPKHVCEVCNRKFYSFTKLRVHKNVHLPNHVGRVKRAVDPEKANRPKVKRPRKPKKKEDDKEQKNSKTKASTGRGRGRPRKIQKQESEEDSEDHEFERTEVFSSSSSYVLDMHQHQPHVQVQSHSQYQLPISSTYNTPAIAHQHVGTSSVHQTPGTSYRAGQIEYQIQGSQAIGLYMDPNLYFNHLMQMNPPNNNS